MVKKIDEIEIQAVHDRDLKNILDSLGISPRIDDGSLLCRSCLQPISWDNIGAIYILGEEAILCCNLADCLEFIKGLRENA
ncbi:MAG: hypothetical protein PHQ86_08525 [Dehalococcoidales bacterium]|nr:hypothetical protein [Dehalococcoidales bacterium]